MRPALVLATLLALHALPATGVRAAGLADLPRFVPGAAATVPGWRSDRIELRLRTAAARAAVPLGTRTPMRDALAAPLGVVAVDGLARTLGVALTPEFADEPAPAPEASEPDLTAYWVAALPPGLDLADALARFAALPEVESASPIAVVPVSIVSRDSLMNDCSWLLQLSGHDIHATEAWDLTTGDSSIVVAVLDTGVLPYHPDLGGVVAGRHGNLFVNAAERDGVAGVDDDGNGAVDDVAGYDFVALGAATGVASGEDWRDADADPNDFAGHGTAVAGLIGAIGDNDIGLPGVAWTVRLLPVRVAWSDVAAPLGLVDMSFVAQGIRYATRSGARVINASFATVSTPGLVDATSAAVRAGVAIVLAAGNSGQPQELGLRGDVITVAAVDGADVVAAFSNQGGHVDVAAPGVGLLSTGVAHVGGDSLGLRQPTYWSALSGTSFAAPLVSGTLALAQADRLHHGRRPLDAWGALLRVRDTADDIAALQPANTRIGTGRLDARGVLDDRATSLAIRGRALTIGPPVVISQPAGLPRLVYATQDQKLLILDGARGDTVRVVSLGGRPARLLAAADMGGGRGVRIYAGLTSSRLAGFDRDGNALAGFPVDGPGVLWPLTGGPALGDLDGDGVLDVVCGAQDGSVWAWDADGVLKAGFPVALGGAAVDLPVALAPLDESPGDEIVAVAADGTLHALAGDGGELAGFPIALGGVPVAPVIARFDAGAAPLILAAAGGTLRALRADGSTHFSVPLGGSAVQDPALADLDGDQRPEIVVALATPSALAAFDSSGAPLGSRGWPRALGAIPTGPPVAGHFLGGARGGVLLMLGSGLAAFDDSARALPRFPMPGGAGLQPTLADLDGDLATEVAAGTGPDSTLFIYDMGAGSGDPAPSWSTPRGDFARSGAVAAHPSALAIGPSPPRAGALALAVGRRPSGLPVRLTWSGAVAAPSRLALYDVAGRRVRGFRLGAQAEGRLEWDGRDEAGSLVPAGLYFARLTSGSLHVQTRVVLLP